MKKALAIFLALVMVLSLCACGQTDSSGTEPTGTASDSASVPADGDKLLAANENPDLYPDLVVRVTGFTAYFASLSPEFRQLVVDRFLNGM